MKALALVVMLAACKDKPKETPPPPPPADAGFVHPAIDAREVAVEPIDWAACKKALEAAPKTPQMRRVQSIVGACRPCGDWKPLLDWSKDQVDGGPTRAQIEDSMIACKAYCNSDAKQRFLGTLDKFRGKDTRGPWRFLGELCKEQVSAVPDNRYSSAPWFALDRIARAVGGKPDLAPLLDTFDFPLPVISISGYGYELAKSPVTAPDAGPLALTVTPNEIRIAVVSRGKLAKDGVVTLAKGESYPGVVVKTPKELDAAIAKLGTTAASGSGSGSAPSILTDIVVEPGTGMAIFAPHGMVATRLLDALAVTGERPRKAGAAWLTGDVRLAVQADGGLTGWPLAGSIPVALRSVPVPDAIHVDLDDNPDPTIEKLKADKAKLMAVIAKHRSPDEQPDRTTAVVSQDPPTGLWKPALAIHLGPKATVAGLAKLIGAAVYFDVKSVALMRGGSAPK